MTSNQNINNQAPEAKHTAAFRSGFSTASDRRDQSNALCPARCGRVGGLQYYGSGQHGWSDQGVSCDRLHVTRTAVEPCELELDSSELNDIKADLVDKSFGWKGNHFTIRSFARGAGHNELGLQAVQLVGDADGDCDRVANELILGDMTAPTVYMAALQRPVSQIEPAAGQPNNEISSAEGQVHLKGELASEEEEIATAHCFSGFRRCGVGPGLADPYDSLQLSASMFLTRSLAGVGLTGSQLHDVRATQLCEVIVRHGGDVAQSASQFKRLSAHAQLVACIENLLIYLTEEGHDEAPRLPVRDIDRLSFWGP